jgi:hypothetical protein
MTGMKIRTTIIFLQNEEVHFPSTPFQNFVLDKPRGASPLRQFLFSLGGGRLGFQQKTSLMLRGATDLREEINPPQAEQY